MPAFTDLIDLAAERLGGAVLYANDEFFAPKEALLKAAAPVWREGEYTERGKWMDGWETRRRRSPGHDWCIIRLGLPGTIHGVVVDTSFFTGNYPESCAIDVCHAPGLPTGEQLADESRTAWTPLLPLTPLTSDSRNAFPIATPRAVTHLRFSIHPDGGVARLRVFGVPSLDRERLHPGSEVDVAAMENGGIVVACSDMFYGHRHNLILPGRSTHMGDGWETKRRRGPGNDWVVVRLAARAALHRVEIDTDHFRGNAPDSCALDTCDQPAVNVLDVPDGAWRQLLGATPLQPHARHRYAALAHAEPATHARLSIFPDGGIARLRLYGMLV